MLSLFLDVKVLNGLVYGLQGAPKFNVIIKERSEIIQPADSREAGILGFAAHVFSS